MTGISEYQGCFSPLATESFASETKLYLATKASNSGHAGQESGVIASELRRGRLLLSLNWTTPHPTMGLLALSVVSNTGNHEWIHLSPDISCPAISLETSKEAKGYKQWHSDIPNGRKHIQPPQTVVSWTCLMEKSASSDLQVSFSPAQSSNLPVSLSQSSQYFPSLDFQSFNLPLLKLAFPQKHFNPNNATSESLSCPLPCTRHPCVLPLCPQLPSPWQLQIMNPSFCLVSPWRGLCFQGCLKNPSRHIQYLFRRKEKHNSNKSSLHIDKKLSLVICWRNMMCSTSSYTLRNSSQCLPNMWYNLVRGVCARSTIIKSRSPSGWRNTMAYHHITELGVLWR